MIALLLFGIGLYVIGSLLEGHEKANRDRKWDEWLARREAWRNGDRTGPRPNDWGPD